MVLPSKFSSDWHGNFQMEQWVRIWTFWRGTEQAVRNFEWVKTLWGNGSSTRPRCLSTRSSFVETTVFIRTFHCSADVHEKFKNHSLKNDMNFCRWKYDEWHLHSSHDRLIGFLACSIHSATTNFFRDNVFIVSFPYMTLWLPFLNL